MMTRRFCIAGPIIPEKHYFLPHRLDWPLLNSFIENQFYFVLHAPRQSGKTTAIREYVNYLNHEHRAYTTLYLSTEPAHSAKNDVQKAMFWLLVQLKSEIIKQLDNQLEIIRHLDDILKEPFIREDSFFNFLNYWASENAKPIVLFLDEIDGLVADPLIALLKQLRTGHSDRPKHFPQSVCLIGVRDLRDYKIKSKEDVERGVLYSPFNVKAESVRLPDFSLEEVNILYLQHTQETGQIFTADAIQYAYHLTRGQPWLVNALAYQACFRENEDRTIIIDKVIIDKAKDKLIARRDTHIDALLDRLNDERVRGVLDAIISSKTEISSFESDDLQYVRDLGLLKENSLEIANPIYQEIIPRTLVDTVQQMIPNTIAGYLDNPNKLNMHKLLSGFSQFFRENVGLWGPKFQYQESMPHLLLMAFLQRVINGGGSIHREYALGRKRVDLLIIWKNQKFVIEIQIKRNSNTLENGLLQTAEYMDISGAAEGHLVIFDRDSSKTWEEKISTNAELIGNKTIQVWRL